MALLWWKSDKEMRLVSFFKKDGRRSGRPFFLFGSSFGRHIWLSFCFFVVLSFSHCSFNYRETSTQTKSWLCGKWRRQPRTNDVKQIVNPWIHVLSHFNHVAFQADSNFRFRSSLLFITPTSIYHLHWVCLGGCFLYYSLEMLAKQILAEADFQMEKMRRKNQRVKEHKMGKKCVRFVFKLRVQGVV